MDWGIVASVLVALTLFLAAILILILMMAGLFVWRIKRHARKQGDAIFKFPCCPIMKSAQNTP